MTCVVELEQSVTSGGDGATPKKRVWRIWWDDQHQRTDCLPAPPERANRIVHCIHCETVGSGLIYHEEDNLLASLKPLADYKQGSFTLIRDPKVFGHSFGGLSQNEKSIDSLIARMGVKKAQAGVVEGPFGEMWELRWPTDDPGVSFAITADPNRGFEITSIESKGKDFRESIRADLKRWGEVWYPERITFEQWFGDKRQRLEEVVIKSATFNQLIPPETFTLAGIKMLPGHPIRVNGNLRIEQVDEGKIGPLESNANSLGDPTPPPSAAPVRVAEPGEWRVNPWLLAAGVALAVSAVALIVRRYLKRRPTP
jgi:hypothetical protein